MEQQENTTNLSTQEINTKPINEVSSKLPEKEASNAKNNKSIKTKENDLLKTAKEDLLKIQPQDIGLYDKFVEHMKHIRDVNDITAILRAFPISKLNPDSYVPVTIPKDDEGNDVLDRNDFLSPIDGTPGVYIVPDTRMEVSRIPNAYLTNLQTEIQSNITSKGRQMYRNAPYNSLVHYPMQIGDYQLDSALRTPLVYPLARWLYSTYTTTSPADTFEIISIDYYEKQLSNNDTTFTNINNAIRDPNAIYLDLSSTNNVTSVLAKLAIFDGRNVVDLSNTIGRQGPLTVTANQNVDILDFDIAKILDDTLTYQDIDLGLWFLAAPILAYTDYDPTHWKVTGGYNYTSNYAVETTITSFPALEIAIPRYNQAEAIVSYFFNKNEINGILASSVNPQANFDYVFTDILLDYRLLKTFALQECLKAKGCLSSAYILMFPEFRETLRFADLNIRNYHDLPYKMGGVNDTHRRMLYGQLLFKSGTQTTAASATGPTKLEFFFPANIPYEIVSQYEPDHGAQEMKYQQCRNIYNGYISEVIRPSSQVIPWSYDESDFRSNIIFSDVNGWVYYIDYRDKLNNSPNPRTANTSSTSFSKPIAVIDNTNTLVGLFPTSTRCYFNAIHTGFNANPTANTSCYRNFDSRADIKTTKLSSNNFHTSFSDYKTY